MSESVPFGKYKDQALEVLLADQAYLNWIANQPDIIAWLKSNYPELFETISRRTDQDSVQHNRLQAKFVKSEFCFTFLETIQQKNLSEILPVGSDEKCLHVWGVSFESEGCDVVLWLKKRGVEHLQNEYRIEIKPILGDDFPAVLRQMKRSKANILLIEKFSSAACSLEEVKEIFSPIKIFFFHEIQRCLPADQS